MTLDEANLKESYFKVLASTGIGAAVNNGELLLPKQVMVIVPESMHNDYPARLLGSAIQICANEPYLWTVKNIEPQVDQDTTFQTLWDQWMIEIITA